MTIATVARTAALALAASSALAHPGHDTAPPMGFVEGLMHLLTQPDHLGMLGVALVTLVVVVRRVRADRRADRRRGGSDRS